MAGFPAIGRVDFRGHVPTRAMAGDDIGGKYPEGYLMQHPKSRRLAAIITDWSKPASLPKGFLERIGTYPHNHRAAIFCWLWDNHDDLALMLQRWKPSWDTIAGIMAEDGIKGRYGAPPTGDAARRVWKRVCREIEEKRKRSGQLISLPAPR
jgi:hypothetical protein